MRVPVLGTMLALAVVAGCVDEGRTPAEPENLVVPVFTNVGDKNFRTHLGGDEEVPANGSQAQGQAIFQLSKDGTQLHYRLIVANIENVLQAHIHMAPAGTNGPVVAWLYPSAPPAQLIPGRTQGTLGEGVITDANVVGPLAGQGLAALLAAIHAGNTYVNVHTTQIPGGEIRGQID